MPEPTMAAPPPTIGFKPEFIIPIHPQYASEKTTNFQREAGTEMIGMDQIF